jgi:flagellar biosynthesis protein FlhB
MAEEVAQNRTETATPRRREEAREQGQVAHSRELTVSLVLLAGLAALALAGGTIGPGLIEQIRHDFWLSSKVADFQPETVQALVGSSLSRGLELLSFLFAIVIAAAVASSALQVGFQVTPVVLALQWERLSPVAGWSRLFSTNSSVVGLVTLFKIATVGIVAYCVIKGPVQHLGNLQQCSLAVVLHQAWSTMIQLGMAVAGALVVVGAVDYAWQWWRLEQSLRMTKQEVKEEVKRDEGDPQFKARIRKLQRQAAQKRMLQDVPTATVVVTNPTHLAVALRYERGSMPTPVVVAKGAGELAHRIAELARRHSVPVLERKPVAQALFKSVKVGQQIPATLYQVVAELLAYVYRLRAT